MKKLFIVFIVFGFTSCVMEDQQSESTEQTEGHFDSIYVESEVSHDRADCDH